MLQRSGLAPELKRRIGIEELLDLQTEYCAEDLQLDFSAMRTWSEDDCRAFFSSGGKTKPRSRSSVEGKSTEQQVSLDRYRVWGVQGETIYAGCSDQADVVGRVKRGAALLAIGQLSMGGRRWVRIIDPYDGYADSSGLKLAFDEPSLHFQLVRVPRAEWPEPRRGQAADVAFTITFNGRIKAFYEAIGSVLTQLSSSSLATIDTWVVVCDKGATSEQRVELMRSLPWMTFIGKGSSLHGHPISMNLLAPFLRTQWWVQWEDDWALPADGSARNLLDRARDVAIEGCYHQVAVNGAWQRTDPAWGEKGPPKERQGRRTTHGTPYLDVNYPPEDRSRMRDSIHSLVNGWSANQQQSLRDQGVQPLQWPLYSNQPSFNDTRFLLALFPFSEKPEYRSKEAYWMWEFEFGVRFVIKAGRKATLEGSGLAYQQMVSSSSSSG